MASGKGGILRFFSASILIQGLSSAANLGVGLLLIRRTSDLDYSYYVLVSNAILLLTVLQYAYAYPSMVYSVTDASGTATTRGDFVGGLFREQQRLLLGCAGVLAIGAVVGRLFGVISNELMLIVLVGVATAAIALYREFFRMVLTAHRAQTTMLRGDIIYVVVLVIGVAAATLFPHPAIWAITAVAIAAFAAGRWLKRTVYKFEAWNIHGRPGLLREIFSVGAWATAGAGSHWAFTQGYNYMVAGVLSVASVASIAATRTLIMPINLISLGIGNVMLPTASGWLQRMPTRKVMVRLAIVAAGLVVVSAVYMSLIWIFRDWIFAVVLKKNFVNRDQLLLAWFAVGIAMVFRDQLSYLLMARARFRATSFLTMICAALSLTASFLLMRQLGAVGGLLGLLCGEIGNVLGIIALCVLEMKRHPEPSPIPVAAT